MRRFFLPGVILLMLGTGWAEADSALRWDRKEAETQVPPGEKTVRADFGFTNISKQPVVIDSVKSSCGCTTATLEKKTYQPGEKGQITTVFTPGSRKGTQVKAVKVTVKGESDPAVLTLVTRIGEPLEIDPPLVYWRMSEAPSPKTIRVKVPAGAGVSLTDVTSNNPRVTAKLEPGKEAGEYTITVVPLGTNEKMTAVLKVRGTTQAKEAQEFQVYAQIK
jgi:hypothetical protein